MTTLLALKLVLVPVFILAISLAGQRWGPGIAGWLSGMPVVAGPILFFMSVELGAAFAAEAAVATISAVCAATLFSLAYTWGAQRHRWPLSYAGAAAAYVTSIAALYFLAPGFWLAIVASLTFITLAPSVFPRVKGGTAPPAMQKAELLARMAAGVILVLLVTHFANQMGPRWSGLLAMFPVMGSVLAVFTHRHAGAAFTTKLMVGSMAGFYAFIAFCAALAVTLNAWGTAGSFSFAIACTLSVQGVTRVAMRRTVSG